MSTRDDELVRDFLKTWTLGYTAHRISRIERDLRDLIAAAREDERKQQAAASSPDLSDFERRVREELARVAPAGSRNTPELQQRVKQHMATFVRDELTRLGLPPVFAALIGAGVKVSPKE